MTTLLDGKKVSAAIRAQVTADVTALAGQGIETTLALVIATGDESAAWYVRSLQRAAAKVGISTRLADLGAAANEADISAALADLAASPAVHGIVLQAPLPAGVRRDALVSAIPLAKDVDGASPLGAGRLMAGLPVFAPATAAAVLELLEAYDVPLSGSRAVVVGRSMVVGLPVAHLLLARNATVPAFFGRDHVRPGAAVIDVGTTPDEDGKLTGDVDADQVGVLAGALTPVPGGVGPVTTALLLRNTARAAARPPAAS